MTGYEICMEIARMIGQDARNGIELDEHKARYDMTILAMHDILYNW